MMITKAWQSPDGELVLHLVSFTTLRHEAVSDELAAIIPAASWREFHTAFIGFAAHVISAEFAEALSLERQGLKMFIECRTGITAHDWPLFLQFVGRQAIDDYWTAYAETRDTALQQLPPTTDDELTQLENRLNTSARGYASGRQRAEVESKGIRTIRPPLRQVRTPESILSVCYQLWSMSGFTVLPRPDEVLSLPVGYVNDIITYHHLVKFYEDAPKRPVEMRGTKKKKKTPGKSESNVS